MASQKRPSDDPSSAPESGTVRDNTTGNQPANAPGRSVPGPANTPGAKEKRKPGEPQAPDDPSVAGEER